VRLATHDWTGALRVYEQALAVARRLAEADPGDNEWQRVVSFALTKLSDARLAGGDRAGAVQGYEEALAIDRQLFAANQDSAEFESNLLESLWKLATASGDTRQRRDILREALKIATNLEARGAVSPEQKGWRQMIEAELTKLGK